MITSEIRFNCKRFSNRWKYAKKETSEFQLFINEFFGLLGIDFYTHGKFEYPCENENNTSGRGSIDAIIFGEILIEQKSKGEDLFKAFDTQVIPYLKGLKNKEYPKVAVLCDFEYFHFYDLTSTESKPRIFKLNELYKNIDLFDFLITNEDIKFKRNEIPVNENIARMMGQIHNELKNNGFKGDQLEEWLIRLLFCMYAEDSEIFNKDIFLNYIKDTREDGVDLGPMLSYLFDVLDTPLVERDNDKYNIFPYVNGGIFKKKWKTPLFTKEVRDLLIRCCLFDWSQISPIIFGNLFESTMKKNERHGTGAFYTPKDNILMCLDPLFLNDLGNKFESVKNNNKDLIDFYNYISSLTFLDPTEGCGNFLLITYEQLRLLEIEILKILINTKEINVKESRIKLNNFYGIDLNLSAVNIANISMILMEHKLNQRLILECNLENIKILPIRDTPNIYYGNSLLMDWSKINKEIDFIIGNPPFITPSNMKEMTIIEDENIVKTKLSKNLKTDDDFKYISQDPKKDMKYIFKNINISGIDYCMAFFKKSCEYLDINSKCKVCLIGADAINKRTHVINIWTKLINEHNIFINFAHDTFEWKSNRTSLDARTSINIFGFSKINESKKYLWDSDGNLSYPVTINPYLKNGDFIIEDLKRINDINNNIPKTCYSAKYYSPYLIENKNIKSFINDFQFLKKYIMFAYRNGRDFLKNNILALFDLTKITDKELKLCPKKDDRLINLINPGNVLFDVKDFKRKFKKWNVDKKYIIIPSTISINYFRLPCTLMEPHIISLDGLCFIENPDLFTMGILMSSMFFAWVKYYTKSFGSTAYGFNIDTYKRFYWPNVNEKQKVKIIKLVKLILEKHVEYSNSSLSVLYKDNPPMDLLKLHESLDVCVDYLYQNKKFKNESERILCLSNYWSEYNKLKSKNNNILTF